MGSYKPDVIPVNRTFKRAHTKRKKTEKLVIHHGASSIHFTGEDYFDWHVARDFYGLGYNAVVEWKEVIKLGRPLWAIGAHSTSSNGSTIGICLVGDFTIHKPSNGQYKALAWYIVNVIQVEYPHLQEIGKHIVAHSSLDPTACPGILFNFSILEKYMKEMKEDDVMDWQKKIMQEGHDKGLIDLKHGHKATDSVQKWFVVAIAINLYDMVKKLIGGK